LKKEFSPHHSLKSIDESQGGYIQVRIENALSKDNCAILNDAFELNLLGQSKIILRKI
jgi:hypothetical protein